MGFAKMVLTYQNEFTSRIENFKIVQSIREIMDFFHPNPNQTHPFHRRDARQPVEPLKIFQKLKEKSNELHFDRTISHPLSKVHLMHTLSSTSVIIFDCVFLVSVTDSIDVMLESVYVTTSSISIYFVRMNTIFVAPKLYKFIDGIEGFVNGSEYEDE